MSTKFSLKGGSGNLKGSTITRAPADLDPATAKAALDGAEEFAWRCRDLIDRGHKPRHAIVIAIKNLYGGDMYEKLKKREGFMERLFAYFEKEIERLNKERDAGAKLVRGVAVGKGKIEIEADAIILGLDGQPMGKTA